MRGARGARRWVPILAIAGAAALVPPFTIGLPAQAATSLAAHGDRCRGHDDPCRSDGSSRSTGVSTVSVPGGTLICPSPAAGATAITCTAVPSTTTVTPSAPSTGTTGTGQSTDPSTGTSTTGTGTTGASTGTGTPVDPSTLAAGSLAWDSDFTASGLSRLYPLDRTPQNFTRAGQPALVSSPTTAGKLGLQFTVPGGGNRSEVQPNITDFRPGDDRWFGFSFTLPAGFPTEVTDYQLLTQWKNEGTGSPPLQLTVERGTLRLRGGYGHPDGPRVFDLALSPADTGRRIDMVVHIVFSPDPATGSVDVFRDGRSLVTGYHPPGGTMYPRSGGASSYWKMGLYRSSALSSSATYVLEHARLGTGYQAVAGP